DKPDHWRFLLRLLAVRALPELNACRELAQPLLDQVEQVGRECVERFPELGPEWMIIRLDTLLYWCRKAERDHDAQELLFCAARWRQNFEELTQWGGAALTGQLFRADRLVPLEAQILWRQGEWLKARSLLESFQRLVDTQAPSQGGFEWSRAQALARIALARLDYQLERRREADVSLGEALDRLTPWLKHPQVGPGAYECWFEARLSQLEHRQPGTPYEVEERELLDLRPHCPSSSLVHYCRVLFDTALRAGRVEAARKALALLPNDEHLLPRVGEELNHATLKACLESQLPEQESSVGLPISSDRR
ncbi:MAG: hypothetical protein ACKO3P_02190, partial [Planctomycetaceae bacterium]